MDEQRESPCTVRGASGGSRRGSGLVQRGPVRVFRSFASSPARLSGGARLVAASSKTAWLGAAAVSGAASVCHGTASASQRGVTAAAGTSGRPKRPASLCVLSLRLVESRRTGSSRGPRRLGHPPWERASCPPPPGGLRGGGYGAGGRRLREGYGHRDSRGATGNSWSTLFLRAEGREGESARSLPFPPTRPPGEAPPASPGLGRASSPSSSLSTERTLFLSERERGGSGQPEPRPSPTRPGCSTRPLCFVSALWAGGGSVARAKGATTKKEERTRQRGVYSGTDAMNVGRARPLLPRRLAVL
ncbi:hypothetical protein HPB47_026330 [Ixodes persulcatus]|uniref:Uncharacterized protein n=1 Tax=Ixodes persulcatus TaxID=34615 RepID=A0AC60Q093_IXOPE|nr:hypothetical protein HPB47_026330 [Ixodes persulcatus]